MAGVPKVEGIRGRGVRNNIDELSRGKDHEKSAL